MHFKTLETLQADISENDKKQDFLDAIIKLDIWLLSISRRQSEHINPLDFAENENVTWRIATKVFHVLTKKKFFGVYYAYRNPSTGDVLITSTNRKAIVNKQFVFDSFLEEDVAVDPDLIETVFKLLQNITVKKEVL